MCHFHLSDSANQLPPPAQQIRSFPCPADLKTTSFISSRQPFRPCSSNRPPDQTMFAYETFRPHHLPLRDLQTTAPSATRPADQTILLQQTTRQDHLPPNNHQTRPHSCTYHSAAYRHSTPSPNTDIRHSGQVFHLWVGVKGG